MAGLLHVAVHILMTRHAGVGANVEVFQIAHTGVDAVLVTPIGARVRAEPILGGAVTGFTGNPFADARFLVQLPGPQGVKWRMTNRAPPALRRIADVQDSSDALRAGGFQRRAPRNLGDATSAATSFARTETAPAKHKSASHSPRGQLSRGRIFPCQSRATEDRAHLDTTTRNFVPLPVRNEWGEGWGEGHSIKLASSPQPSPPPREEREKTSSGRVVVSRCAPEA